MKQKAHPIELATFLDTVAVAVNTTPQDLFAVLRKAAAKLDDATERYRANFLIDDLAERYFLIIAEEA